MINIPNFKTLDIKHIVCDYNGTIAKDGILLDEVKELFKELSQKYTLHVITADTFGSVHSQLDSFDVKVKVLSSSDHTEEKAEYIRELGEDICVSVGNGNNDKAMLSLSSVGVVVLGDEGCAKDALLSGDVVCKNIVDALSLFLNTKRLVATLRK